MGKRRTNLMREKRLARMERKAMDELRAVCAEAAGGVEPDKLPQAIVDAIKVWPWAKVDRLIEMANTADRLGNEAQDLIGNTKVYQAGFEWVLTEKQPTTIVYDSNGQILNVENYQTGPVIDPETVGGNPDAP